MSIALDPSNSSKWESYLVLHWSCYFSCLKAYSYFPGPLGPLGSILPHQSHLSLPLITSHYPPPPPIGSIFSFSSTFIQTVSTSAFHLLKVFPLPRRLFPFPYILLMDKHNSAQVRFSISHAPSILLQLNVMSLRCFLVPYYLCLDFPRLVSHVLVSLTIKCKGLSSSTC